jgi:hypothetical protein
MYKKIIAGLFLVAFSSLALADMSCLNAEDSTDRTGQKEQQIKGGYEKMQDPVQDLFGCFMGVTSGALSASSVKGSCGCKQAVKKHCSFNIKKKRVKASGGASTAWCAVFAPWAL